MITKTYISLVTGIYIAIHIFTIRPVSSQNRTIVVSQAPKLRKFTITKAERNMKLKTLGRLIATFTLLLAGTLLAQETTGGLIGAVKDPSGAVVPGAKVVVTAPSLVGSKRSEEHT